MHINRNRMAITIATALVLVISASIGVWAVTGGNNGAAVNGTVGPLSDGTPVVSWSAYTWAQIAVHGAVALGTIDDTTAYTGATPSGGGAFGNLESLTNNVFVITNDPDGWVLQISVTGTSTPLGFTGDLLGDFQWRETPITAGTYAAATGLDLLPATVDTTAAAGSAVYGFDYKYNIDINDIPGNYSVTVQYTVTTN
ncbi:MAG: hypothetical protein ACE5JP_10770 [Candidatus Bipolaricaulia bacterium]